MSLKRKLIIVICLMVFVAAAGVVLQYVITGITEQNNLKELGKLKTEQKDLVTDKGIVIGKYVNLYLKNKDIIGWVKIKGTNIDYPVMQTQSDPQFYLRRNFAKEESISGTPLMDAASDVFIPTCNFLVYGHNMKNGTMFHDLLEYKDKEFYEKHKTFSFDTIYKGGQAKYEIIAAGYSQIYGAASKKFKYYEYAGITSKKDFKEYVEGVKALSVYDTGVTPKYGEQLVTLSTCAYHVENGRFFVVGRKI